MKRPQEVDALLAVGAKIKAASATVPKESAARRRQRIDEAIDAIASHTGLTLPEKVRGIAALRRAKARCRD